LSREEELNGSLPVLIWNEQKKYLECIKEGSNISANLKTKKRKREDEDSDDNANNAKRRSRSFWSLFTFMETHIGRFINSIKNVFFSSPTQMQIHNVQNNAPSSTAEALDTLESPSSPPPPPPPPKPNTESHDDKLKRNKLSLHDLVFQDLNKKGYFVGPGDVYGADYSIYTGSPSDNHSIATVRILPAHETTRDLKSSKVGSIISVKDLLSYSRVTTHANKKAAFAFSSIDKESNCTTTTTTTTTTSISYLMFTFEGVGSRVV